MYKEYNVLIDLAEIHKYVDYKVDNRSRESLNWYNKNNRSFHAYFSRFGHDFNTALSCVTNSDFRNEYARSLGTDPNELYVAAVQWRRCMAFRKEFTYNHPAKIKVANWILENRIGYKAITFSQSIEVAESVKYGKSFHSDLKTKERRTVLEEFNKGEFDVINTAKSLDVGADIPALQLGIVISGTSSPTQLTQRRGR